MSCHSKFAVPEAMKAVSHTMIHLKAGAENINYNNV